MAGNRSVGRSVPVRDRAAGMAVLLGIALAAGAAAAPAYDWLQFNGDPAHSGNNTAEAGLTAANVSGLTLLFRASLPAATDGAPVALAGVATPVGTRDLLFVTTTAGHIVALDARSGATLWSKQYGPGSCRINGGGSPCYTTSSPAIDPGRLYVYSYGLDGNVHKFQAGDGTEVVTGGWPQAATLKAFDEKGSSPLTFATALSGTTHLYAVHGGYPGDAGDYQGHVTAIDLATAAQKVFNTMCSDNPVHFVHSPGTPDCSRAQSAVWARSGVVYDAVTDRIFVGTGNGQYNASSGGHNWSESVLALSPDGTGSGGGPLDSYTPSEFQSLDNADADLGSTAPAILPAPGYAGRLALQSGKDGFLRLINLANLSGSGAPGHVGGELQKIAVPQGAGVITAPAVWVNPADSSTWAFVSNGAGISGLHLTVAGGVPSIASVWQNGQGGTSPIVANGVLYQAGSGFVRALNPTTGAVLWSSNQVGSLHWQSPVVANGVLYVADQSARVSAFALGPLAFSVTPRFGPASGGTSVTILGIGFQSGATVQFGGVAATGTFVAGPGAIGAATPPGTGVVDVTITNPGPRTATMTGAFSYGPAQYFSVTPCRLVDTRNPAGPFSGPALAAASDRAFLAAGQCGIPPAAKAVSVNVTVTQPSASGDLRLYAGSGPLPAASALNYRGGQTRANNTVVALGAAGDFAMHCDQVAGTVQVIVDVNGYFQ
jgi:outer membrane protein assembly factor BamB